MVEANANEGSDEQMQINTGGDAGGTGGNDEEFQDIVDGKYSSS